MVLQSLLVCRDPQALSIFRRALGELTIEVQVSKAASSASELLERNKFDAIIVDCDDVAAGTEVLTGIQQAPSNKRALAIALINGTTSVRGAFEMGAHFVLEKPITVERVLRALRAAQGFMVAERRRYFRHPVETKADLSFGLVKPLPCKVTNISDGGMAVVVSQQISPNLTVDVRFELPGVSETLKVKGEVAWSDGRGNAGIRFTHLPADSKRWLGEWLAERMEEAGAGRILGNTSLARPTVI